MVIVERAAVTDRLADLGLSLDGVLEAVKRGQSARNSVTANHPPIAGGLLAWLETTRALRDIFVPQGGARNDGQNFSRLVCPKGDADIAVTTGDENTCNPDVDPQPRYSKGPAVKDIVGRNQVEMFPGLEAEERQDSRTTWFLLIRRQGEVVNVELSRPQKIAKDGFVT